MQNSSRTVDISDNPKLQLLKRLIRECFTRHDNRSVEDFENLPQDVFLIKVVLVLVTKLHPVDPSQHAVLAAKKATRAACILIFKSLTRDLRQFNMNRIKEATERNKRSKVFARDPKPTDQAEDEYGRIVSSNHIPLNHLDVLWCPRTFDGFACWPETPATTTATQPCPDFVVGFDPSRLAYKTCTENGTWFLHPETSKPWTNYTTCVDVEDLDFRSVVNNIYVCGYSMSVVALLLSLAIFVYFRSLQCTRIRIHMHLFSSFTLSDVLWIVWYRAVVTRVDVVSHNKIPLFGLHFVLIPLRPTPDSPGEKPYQIISALITSLQGLCVAILFCFTNHDVIVALRAQLARIRRTNEAFPMTGATGAGADSLIHTRENVV